MKYLIALVVAALVLPACSPKEDASLPSKSSEEAHAMAIAVSNAAIHNPQDALSIAGTLSSRSDVSAEDRAAAAAAQQAALKKLSEAAANGDSQAKAAVEQYRANK